MHCASGVAILYGPVLKNSRPIQPVERSSVSDSVTPPAPCSAAYSTMPRLSTVSPCVPSVTLTKDCCGLSGTGGSIQPIASGRAMSRSIT